MFESVPVSAWLLTPLLIFLARICDVSIGTIRIISLARGHRFLAPVLGFFEILIWLIAIRQIFQHLDNPAAFVAYAAGFAAGNFVGMKIEERLALGMVAVRLITSENATSLVSALSEADYGVTTFAAQGVTGEVRLIFMIIKRKDLDRVMALVDRFRPGAFVTISDVRSVSQGVFPEAQFRVGGRSFPGFFRKGK